MIEVERARGIRSIAARWHWAVRVPSAIGPFRVAQGYAFLRHTARQRANDAAAEYEYAYGEPPDVANP